jgi:hypothetical protein
VPHPRRVCEGAVVDFRTLQPERISVLADNMTNDGTHTYTWDALTAIPSPWTRFR